MSSWIPQGTHEVVIGPSLHKALKARKGGPPPQAKRVGPPERDFYSFRYNFKPPSLDNTKPGTIELSRGKDATTVNVEHPSSQPGESHIYTGNETAAKELDCVLIYDEETGSYKLEKLETYIVLTYERKTAISLPVSTASSPPKAETDSSETRRSMDVDAEGEVDDDVLPNFPPKEEEEEEEEGEFEAVPVPVPVPPPPVAVKPSKPATQKARAETARTAAKPAPQRKPPKRAPPQAEPDAGDVDEEVLEFGHPSVKRRRWTPTTAAVPAAPTAPASISFPSSSTGWVPPPAPASKAVKSSAAAPPVSDSEDDLWEEVPAGAIAAAPDDAPIEIEIDVFEAELEKEMLGALEGDDDVDADADADADEGEEGSDGDFLARALPQTSEAGTGATSSRVPLSMGQLAGYSDDEEYSSSEESDDD